MPSRSTVLGALRTFLPELAGLSCSPQQQRAIRAITQCRTPAMGGRVFVCERCDQRHFAWHSCNHKACPQCGREATRRWVERELGKRINAPYFLVTFTLHPNCGDASSARTRAKHTTCSLPRCRARWPGSSPRTKDCGRR